MMLPLVSSHINTGLELEYENIDANDVRLIFANSPIALTHWDVTRDGSLRPQDNNTELKFSGPLSGQSILAALKCLDLLKDRRFTHGWRCGMHVHVDYTGAPYLYAHNTYVIAALLEPILFAAYGKARTESKFCGSASRLAYSAIKNALPLDAKKYSAVNLASLSGHTTVEFRYADSTRDTDTILDFINTNLWIRLQSERYASAWEFVHEFMEAGSPLEWVRDHAPPLVSERLLQAAEELGDDYPLHEVVPTALALADHQDTLGDMLQKLCGRLDVVGAARAAGRGRPHLGDRPEFLDANDDHDFEDEFPEDEVDFEDEM